MKSQYDVVVVGGGFYGLYIAEYLAKQGKKVLVCESNEQFMSRASYVNQARVHNGYHYPRSTLTALRSRISFPRFVDEFSSCIDSTFDKYYAIGRPLGKVSAERFYKFCQRIQAPIEEANSSIKKLTNPRLVENVFLTKEFAFNASELKEQMLRRLSKTNADLCIGHEVIKINKVKDGIECFVKVNDLDKVVLAKQVFNCTYSSINKVNNNSNIELIPLKHEVTELCLASIPDELEGKAFTIMCGPFFSIMPFPAENCYSISHVRYTPHYEFFDKINSPYFDASEHIKYSNKNTAWRNIILDAKRYIPLVGKSDYIKSLWETKTVLPVSEIDDSRPILFKEDFGEIEGYHCVMGGKIDNVYDVIEMIDERGICGIK